MMIAASITTAITAATDILIGSGISDFLLPAGELLAVCPLGNVSEPLRSVPSGDAPFDALPEFIAASEAVYVSVSVTSALS